jgi:hypothetical protein
LKRHLRLFSGYDEANSGMWFFKNNITSEVKHNVNFKTVELKDSIYYFRSGYALSITQVRGYIFQSITGMKYVSDPDVKAYLEFMLRE